MTTPTSAAPTKVTLRLLEKTDREIVKLDRAIVGAVYKFQHDFRANPGHPGLRLKQLEGHDRLYSARVNADYRALLLQLSESEWLLVAVKHRGHVYENLDRLSYGINQVTGSIDYVDLEIVESGVLRKGCPPAARAVSQQAPATAQPERERPLFARRAGRGRSITRADRAEIWQLAERFTQRLDERNLETHRQVAERAARLEIERTARIEAAARAKEERGGLGNVHAESATGAWQRHRYRHIVVDEAQDLAAAHWKMLRAMAAPGPDDIFLVGDTHQRIYDNRVTLGSLGVHIRGRSAKLTLSYRTTREILKSALGVLGDEHYDDLDGDEETLAGYRSVLYGSEPVVLRTDSAEDELDAITEQIKAWHDIRREDIAVCVPTNDMVTQVGFRLAKNGIVSTEITAGGPRGDEGVHIGTMYRFKGLEYQRMIIAGVQRGLVPRASVEALRRTDPSRYQTECKRARSLLFVAATRARDTLTIVWHGEPSLLLGDLSATATTRWGGRLPTTTPPVTRRTTSLFRDSPLSVGVALHLGGRGAGKAAGRGRQACAGSRCHWRCSCSRVGEVRSVRDGAGVARTPHGSPPGRLTEAPWEPELTRARTEHGTPMVEGLVADVLLGDLLETTRQGCCFGSS